MISANLSRNLPQTRSPVVAPGKQRALAATSVCRSIVLEGFVKSLKIGSVDSLRFSGHQQIRLRTCRLDPASGKQIDLNHTSATMREPKTFGRLVKLLHDDFPQGVPIEIYAGSHGEDAISMALCLLSAFEGQAGKYPITVSDLCPENMERSRQGIVPLTPKVQVFSVRQPHWILIKYATEIQTLISDPWQYLAEEWAKAQTASDDLMKTPLEGLINPARLDEKDYPHFLLKHDTQYVNGLWRGTPYWEASFRAEQLHALHPQTQKRMSELIHFESEPVDVVAALSQKPKHPERPRVVMLRNMVYLLSAEPRKTLLQALKHNLPPGSLLCPGNSEAAYYSRETQYLNRLNYHGPSFLKALHRAGFRQVGDGNIWRKAQPDELSHPWGWLQRVGSILKNGF